MAKTFQKDGKWTEKLEPAAVIVCDCGGKYLKTRANQVSCLECARRVPKAS